MFQTGDVVWGPHGNFPSWPGKLVSAPQSQPSADGEAGTSITHVDCIQNSWIQTKVSIRRGFDYFKGYFDEFHIINSAEINTFLESLCLFLKYIYVQICIVRTSSVVAKRSVHHYDMTWPWPFLSPHTCQCILCLYAPVSLFKKDPVILVAFSNKSPHLDLIGFSFSLYSLKRTQRKKIAFSKIST